ncbi:MAG: DNA polymerase III subunit gamma/tau [Gammaproteobacteria bacterium]|nr:MAG: DNA polymerase III subunit gamma/tau [Gammaproteobacteria bacterium]
MSYLVLARKWRPGNFSEMVGQEHVVRALVNALDNDRLHHAFLFTGTRGVGKTTIARILAKSLNCEQGLSSSPCGACATCQDIDAGRFFDLIEVDAASRTKVEDTRELLENVQYAPTRGRYKVYLIDEVHMLSKHSFNALLKTLEEPPPHVKFLFATTEPQKLPATILSRCLQFNLRLLTTEEITEQLNNILDTEGIAFEPVATKQLARAARGSMRDALSLLDQAIAHAGGQVTEQEVRDMLGMVEHTHIRDLLAGVVAMDAAAVLATIDKIAERAIAWDDALSDLLSLLHHISIIQAVPDALDEGWDDFDAVNQFINTITPEDAQLFYQIGLIGRRDLGLAPEERTGFEMIMLRMLAFNPQAVDETAASTTAPRSNKKKPVAVIEAKPAKEVQAEKREGKSTPAAKSPPEDWSSIVAAMGLKGIARQLASNSVLAELNDQRAVLHLDPSHAKLLTDKPKQHLEEGLRDYLKTTRLRVEIKAQEDDRDTPAQSAARTRDKRQQAAVDAIEQDENVQALEEMFDATVQVDAIQPRDD